VQRKHPWAYACALTREISRESLDSRQSGLKEQLRSQLARPLGALAGRGCEVFPQGQDLRVARRRGLRALERIDIEDRHPTNRHPTGTSTKTAERTMRALRIQVAGEHRDDYLDLSLTAIEHRARLTRDAMLGSDPRSPGETANGYKVRVPS